MERKLQPWTYDNEKASVTIYPGAVSDTQEKLRKLIEPAMLEFAEAIRKQHPEIIERITRRNQDGD